MGGLTCSQMMSYPGSRLTTNPVDGLKELQSGKIQHQGFES